MILLLSNNLSLVYTMYSLVNNMTVRIKYCTNPGKRLSSYGKFTLHKVLKARPGFTSGKVYMWPWAWKEEGRFQSCLFSSRNANKNGKNVYVELRRGGQVCRKSLWPFWPFLVACFWNRCIEGPTFEFPQNGGKRLQNQTYTHNCCDARQQRLTCVQHMLR